MNPEGSIGPKGKITIDHTGPEPEPMTRLEAEEWCKDFRARRKIEDEKEAEVVLRFKNPETGENDLVRLAEL